MHMARWRLLYGASFYVSREAESALRNLAVAFSSRCGKAGQIMKMAVDKLSTGAENIRVDT